MNDRDIFQIEYKLLSVQEIYGESVSVDYYLDIPPEYFIDADISFYLNGNKFFSDESFPIFKFILDVSDWFKHCFPHSEFIWNEDYFDGWEAIIAIAPNDSYVSFKVISEDAENIEVLIAIDSFKAGLAKFIAGFKATAESFCK